MRFTFFNGVVAVACALSSLVSQATCAPQSTTSDSTEINLGSPWIQPYQLNVTPIYDQTYSLYDAQCTPQPFPANPSPDCITAGISAFTTYFTNVTGASTVGKDYNGTILYIEERGETATTNVMIYWEQSNYLGFAPPNAPYTAETLAVNVIHELQASQYAVACVELVEFKVTVLLAYVENVVLINPWFPNTIPPIVQAPIQVAEPDDPLVIYFNTCKKT